MACSRPLPARRIALFLWPLMLALATPAEPSGLLLIEVEEEGVGGVSGLDNAQSVAVSPNGAAVYVASRGSRAVAVFSRNGLTGALTFGTAAFDDTGGVDGLNGATSVAVSPNSAHVYVASRGDDAVAVFDSALNFIEAEFDDTGGVDGLNNAFGVAVSPDGLHVYVAGRNDNAIAVFSRNTGTGALTFVEAEPTDRPVSVAVSPNGASVYAANQASGGVTVFDRNGTTGELTFVEQHLDGVSGVDGLDSARAVTVNPGGTNVYTVSTGDNAVAVFSRNTTTGELAFVEFERDSRFTNGLRGARAVTVSPNNAFVYAAAEEDDAVSVWRRDGTTGELSYIEAQLSIFVPGFMDPESNVSVAVSPDNAHVYAAGGNRLLAYEVDVCGNSVTGTDEQCDDGNVLGGDGCSATCTLELCGASPVGGCLGPTEAEKGSLLIKDNLDDTRDRLTWKWTKGAVTDITDFGDPTSTASYLVCVYDSSINPQPLLNLAAPRDGTCSGDACWTALSTGYKYSDKLYTPNGLSKVKLKEGDVPGVARMLAKGKAFNLTLPTLPLTLPVTVQVRNTQTSVCWETVFSTFTRNDNEQFKAKSDP